jgi:preprotein translocase subunit SecG
MLTTLVLVIHLIVCVALILIILLQTGKGADIGATFGGGSSQTVFGSSGATPFLSKITIGAAVIFMVTSIVLTYFSDKGLAVAERSLVTESSIPAPQLPASGTEGDKGTTVPQSGSAIPSGQESQPAQEAVPASK